MRLKRSSSQRAKEKSGAKRKAKQTSAYGQGPAKKGTANPVARTSPKVEAASSSTSAGVCVCGSTALSLPVKIDVTVTLVSGRSGTVVGTKRGSGMDVSNGKRDKFSTPCIDDCFCIKPQIRVFTSGCNLGHVGKADRNGLALVNGQSCRSGSPGGCNCTPGKTPCIYRADMQL